MTFRRRRNIFVLLYSRGWIEVLRQKRRDVMSWSSLGSYICWSLFLIWLSSVGWVRNLHCF